jgi:hypothetical protein
MPISLTRSHIHTQTTEQESSSQLPWCTLSTAVTCHFTPHYRTVCLEKVLRQYRRTCRLPVELQPSDASRKERLEAHAIFRNSLHLPLHPVSEPLLLYRNCTRLRKSYVSQVANMYIHRDTTYSAHTTAYFGGKNKSQPLLGNEESEEVGGGGC